MTHKGRRRSPSARVPIWAMVLAGFGALLTVASGGALVYVNSLLDTVNDAVTTTCLRADCTQDDPGGDIEGPLDILVVGSDMRKGWQQAQSDSIMIVHVNADLTAAQIISVPRDLWVDIENCGPGWDYGPCTTKINAAFGAGGEDMAKSVANLGATLTDLTGGVDFEAVAVVNFGGFEEVVELFGGIELCVPFDMYLKHPEGHFVEKGCKEYDPEIALGIVRERYAYDAETPGWKPEYGIGDYGRQRMQQHFFKQLMKKAKDEGYLTDPMKIGTLIQLVGKQFVLDLGGRDVTEFAFALKGIDPGSLTTLKIPSQSAHPPEEPGTWAVMIEPGEQEEAAESLFKALREDDLPTWVLEHPEWVNKTG